MAYVKSAMLRAAVDLRVPDAIHHRGGAATLSDIAAEVGIQPAKVAHGCTREEMTAKKGTRGMFNAGMVSDNRLLMETIIRDHCNIFEGVTSLVDASGAHGATAEAIAKAFPHINCTVLDLPHAIAGAPAISNV
ncbi:(RS)-norcoclaurine 6-O-methyltransferase [Triticum urartu]|uniref:(RS)-norcoclaurine 6-O-methyltransferase n=1 Tax=Triticum urartu TaxID=4572 RepID=M7YGG9_TRIUA|nr:(RS)-norcoclaurine 6-O-methyltransferase [Triticum urartu]